MGLILNVSREKQRVLICQQAFEILPRESLPVPAILASELSRLERNPKKFELQGTFDIVKGQGNIYVSTKKSKSFGDIKEVTPHVPREPEQEVQKVDPLTEEIAVTREVDELELILSSEDPVSAMELKYTKDQLLEMVGEFRKVDYKIRRLTKPKLAELIIEWLREHINND